MILRRIARPLLAAPFVYDGVKAVLWPADNITKWRQKLPEDQVTDDQVHLIARAHGIANVGLGTLLALGVLPRVSAVGLAFLAIDEAWIGNPFDGDAKGLRGERAEKFIESLGRAGAALIAGADLEGKPGARWRIQAARHERADLKKGKNIEHIALV
jgi:uncharacterized membrane protein YphA (DoxX/SURF4 family)